MACFIFLILFLFHQQASSQNAAWIFPPIGGPDANYTMDLIFQIGTTQTLKWESSFTTASLKLNHQAFEPKPDHVDKSSQIATNFSGLEYMWVVDTYGIDISESNVFYITLYTTDGNQAATAYGHYFNLTTEAVPNTTSPGASSGTSSSNAVTSNSTSSATTLTKSEDLSVGAKVGIGIGFLIGALLAIAGACFLLWRRRRRREEEHLKAARGTDEQQWTKPELHGEDIKNMDRTHQIHEMDGSGLPVEMDSNISPVEIG